jgi:hypothetical protein
VYVQENDATAQDDDKKEKKRERCEQILKEILHLGDEKTKESSYVVMVGWSK